MEPGKTGPLQIGFGFLNFADATSTNFMRGAWGGAPNVAEFDYYPSGYYDSAASFGTLPRPRRLRLSPAVNSRHYAPASLILPARAADQPADSRPADLLRRQPNGGARGDDQRRAAGAAARLVLNTPANSQFTAADDFRVDMFSISSYSSIGDDLRFGPGPRHGGQSGGRPARRRSPDLTAPSPQRRLAGAVLSHSNWLYTLERTSDFSPGRRYRDAPRHGGTSMTLQDTNAPPAQAFYRVRAD